MQIRDVLMGKGKEIFSVPANATGRDAVREMNSRRVGALVVLGKGGNIEGIVSERDILRHLEDGPLDRPVKDFMTDKSKLIITQADDAIEYAMSMFTENKIRHLPVLEHEELVGMISIGDAVKALLSNVEYEKKALMDYITGSYAQ